MAAALGDLLFRGAASWKRLVGNTTTTRKFLAQTGDGANSAAPVLVQPTDADLSLSDITTNNVTITAHGFAPKAPSDATKFLNGANPPAWAVPSGAGGIDQLTGDVTAGPGSGSQAATIASSVVTYAKIQNVSATDKVLGRSSSGSGVVEEIVCTSAGRALIDDADASAQRTTLGLGTLSTQDGTFSGTSSGTNTGDVPAGVMEMFAGRTAPTGYLLCDGSAVSRATYATLFAAIVVSVGTVTVTIASPAVFSLTAHGLAAGDAIYVTTTGALPTGLTANTIYYVIAAGLTANAFEVSATRGGSAVNTTGTQSGVHTAVFCPYGLGNGSTTFNVPDMRANVAGGYKSADTNFGNLGLTGGEATHTLVTAEMPAHTHSYLVGVANGSGTVSTGAFRTNTNATTGSTGGDGAHNNLQPYNTVNYIIKT